MSNITNIEDFGVPVTATTFATAVSTVQGNGGGCIVMGSDSAVPPPSDYSGVLLEYNGPYAPTTQFGETAGSALVASKLFRFMDDDGHIGLNRAAVVVESHPKGSGETGPNNANIGMTISLLKQNYDAATVAGECDGLCINVRQGTPSGTTSDCAAILANVANYGAGFTAFSESQTTIFVGGAQTYQIDNQIGVAGFDINGHYDSVGYAANSTQGANVTAYAAQHAGGTWKYLMAFNPSAGNRFEMPIASDGGVAITLIDSGGGSKSINIASNCLRVMNSAGTVAVSSLDDAGNLSIGGALNAAAIQMGTLTLNGIIATSAGLPSGKYFLAYIGGTQYKIALLNN